MKLQKGFSHLQPNYVPDEQHFCALSPRVFFFSAENSACLESNFRNSVLMEVHVARCSKEFLCANLRNNFLLWIWTIGSKNPIDHLNLAIAKGQNVTGAEQLKLFSATQSVFVSGESSQIDFPFKCWWIVSEWWRRLSYFYRFPNEKFYRKLRKGERRASTK